MIANNAHWIIKSRRGIKRLMVSLTLIAVLAACASSPQQPATLPAATLPPTVVAPLATATTTPAPTLPSDPTATLEPTLRPSAVVGSAPSLVEVAVPFDGQRAYQDVIHQVEMGPRTPESAAHAQAVEWMQSELEAAGWQVEIQETTRMDHPVRNVIAKRGSGQPWIIIGAHYDSRMKADQDEDPSKHNEPVPAANDGASGVAVLLELARVLPEDLNGQVWLAFFDTEDQGQLPGWDWILGSRAVADSLTGTPDVVVIVDMIGDADLNIYKERNSDQELTAEIWETAAALGYENVFIPEEKFAMLDDHTPFLEKGIRAVDIIDFDYPYWHTTEDTPDKVSAESLKAVGDTVLHWLLMKLEA